MTLNYPERDPKITIGFHYVDELGQVFDSESTLKIFTEFGCTATETIGAQLNALLRQAGFVRENDYIFMESLNEDELEAVSDFLESYRVKKNTEFEEDSDGDKD